LVIKLFIKLDVSAEGRERVCPGERITLGLCVDVKLWNGDSISDPQAEYFKNTDGWKKIRLSRIIAISKKYG